MSFTIYLIGAVVSFPFIFRKVTQLVAKSLNDARLKPDGIDYGFILVESFLVTSLWFIAIPLAIVFPLVVTYADSVIDR